MSIVYKIALHETEPDIFGFSITRITTIETGITIEDVFMGNWSHDRFPSREAAIAEAKERIEKDKERY